MIIDEKRCLKSLVYNSNKNNFVLNKRILEIYVFDSIHFQDKYMLSQADYHGTLLIYWLVTKVALGKTFKFDDQTDKYLPHLLLD